MPKLGKYHGFSYYQRSRLVKWRHSSGINPDNWFSHISLHKNDNSNVHKWNHWLPMERLPKYCKNNCNSTLAQISFLSATRHLWHGKNLYIALSLKWLSQELTLTSDFSDFPTLVEGHPIMHWKTCFWRRSSSHQWKPRHAFDLCNIHQKLVHNSFLNLNQHIGSQLFLLAYSTVSFKAHSNNVPKIICKIQVFRL